MARPDFASCKFRSYDRTPIVRTVILVLGGGGFRGGGGGGGLLLRYTGIPILPRPPTPAHEALGAKQRRSHYHVHIPAPHPAWRGPDKRSAGAVSAKGLHGHTGKGAHLKPDLARSAHVRDHALHVNAVQVQLPAVAGGPDLVAALPCPVHTGHRAAGEPVVEALILRLAEEVREHAVRGGPSEDVVAVLLVACAGQPEPGPCADLERGASDRQWRDRGTYALHCRF